MRWIHPGLAGKLVRLGYCMNLHAADDLAGVMGGIDRIAVPLARRLGRDASGPFGVGAYLPASVAREVEPGRFAGELADRGLDAFTFNAFPFGGFHRAGLKGGVFRPAWNERERLAFTLDVAEVAAACASDGRAHVSISTHTGAFGAPGSAEVDAIADGFVAAARELALLEERTGVRTVLSLEPEPGSLASTAAELAELYRRIRARADGADAAVARHIGACLDACHAAVEFETPGAAYAAATDGDAPLGKLQFSSALRLDEPHGDAAGRAALLDLDEPVYLHQVIGRRSDGGTVRAGDLPELARRLEERDPAWLATDEWRCHFHVPVDLADACGLGTTREQADALLAHALASPERWGSDELHVEIETYTWDVLPGPARHEGELVDGLEREFAHVIGLLEEAGWRRA